METLKSKVIIAVLIFVIFMINSQACFCKVSPGVILATDEFPPYSFYLDGQLKGIAVDIVKALIDKAGSSADISVLPWKRALNLSKTREMMLFPFTRLPYREKSFQWIGPIMVDSFVFAVRSSEKRAFESVEDFRDVSVGTNRGTPTTRHLQELGFDSLQVVTAENLNAKKLLIGDRIDAWYSSYLILRYTLKIGGFNEEMIRIAYKDMDVEMYIAASLTVPDEIVAQWQHNLNEMKENGKYQEILYESIAEWERLYQYP